MTSCSPQRSKLISGHAALFCCQSSAATCIKGEKKKLLFVRMEDLEEIYDRCSSGQVPVHFHNASLPFIPPQLLLLLLLFVFFAGMLPGKILCRWRASLFDWLAKERGAWLQLAPYKLCCRAVLSRAAGETETTEGRSGQIVDPADKAFKNNPIY